MPTTITIDTRIAAPRELCFDLALDLDAHTESAAFSGEKLVPPGKLSGPLQVGDIFTFEGRHFGMRQRFTAKIVDAERPARFTDEMVHGTFRWLRHVHEFHSEGGITLMRDVLTWKAPLGPIGSLADIVFLKRHMAWFVAKKQNHLKEMAEERFRSR